MSSLDCKSGSGSWGDQICSVNIQKTSKSETVCDCKTIPVGKHFNLATDIFAPPGKLNFDDILKDGCVECGLTVIYLAFSLIAILLLTTVWASKTDS